MTWNEKLNTMTLEELTKVMYEYDCYNMHVVFGDNIDCKEIRLAAKELVLQRTKSENE